MWKGVKTNTAYYKRDVKCPEGPLPDALNTFYAQFPTAPGLHFHQENCSVSAEDVVPVESPPLESSRPGHITGSKSQCSLIHRGTD